MTKFEKIKAQIDAMPVLKKVGRRIDGYVPTHGTTHTDIYDSQELRDIQVMIKGGGMTTAELTEIATLISAKLK